MIEQNRGIACDGIPRELGTQIADLAGKSAAKEGNGGKSAQRIFVCRQKLPRAANQQRAGTLISAGVCKEGKKRGTFRHGGGEGTHFGELEGKVEIGGKLVLDVALQEKEGKIAGRKRAPASHHLQRLFPLSRA